MKKELFYLLGCKGDGCDTSYTDEELANLPWRCNHCGFTLDGVKQIDIMLEDFTAAPKYLAKQKPYTFHGILCADIIWEPFIRTVPQYILDRDMFFGNLIGPDKKRIESWLTCRCRYGLFLRGTKDVALTICKNCGYVRYWAHIKPYLYPAPPDDADIFQCGPHLLFRESVYQYLDMEQWKKKVYVTKITVADAPRDGVELPLLNWPRDLKWVEEHPEIERI